MARFRGKAHHRMDAKGRVSLPAKYRTKLAASELVIVPGVDNCLWLYTEEEHERLIEPLEQNPFDTAMDKLRDLFIADAEDLEVDSAGRIRVSAQHRQYANLTKEVTIVGTGKRLELWDTNDYQQRLQGIDREQALQALSGKLSADTASSD